MQVIIFDFDGTIADNFSLAIGIYNRISERFGTDKVEKEKLPLYRSMKPAHALKKLRITAFKLPFIANVIRAQMKKAINTIPLFDGIREVLMQLKEKGYTLGILSSNNVGNINSFLAHYELTGFDYIFSCKNIFGKHKSLLKFLRNYNLEKKDVTYIGDEIRDIDACRKAGIRIISACWGYNKKEALCAENPLFLADKPADLLNYL